MGDRMALIGRAVALLSCNLPPGRFLLSDYFESEPWGYCSQNKFLNRGVLYIAHTNIAPEDVLDIAQAIENTLSNGVPHRNQDGSYRDRPIDIDLIDIDNIHIQTPRLVLPHPRAHLRPFVMVPMSQLNKIIGEE